MGNKVSSKSITRRKKKSIVKENWILKSSSLVCKENISQDLFSPVMFQAEDHIYDNIFPFIGEHENKISESGEIGLHTHLANCKKNPGHREFIPIESFSLEHLPEGYRDIDLYEFIKATADLTVRISVTMTSPNRPEFWPNTKIPYFLSELRGKKSFRAGTGKVERVWEKNAQFVQDENKHWHYTRCPCVECETSNQPSTSWWEICVDTAAHVVVDKVEARHTTLRLFYDSEESELVVIRRASVCAVKIKKDKCRVKFVTCDKTLGNKLEKMVEHFDDTCEKVRKKYLMHRDIDRLNFIVSHPHGCHKQVSVGHWVDKVKEGIGEYESKFTYTTSTCPGSSGATVYCVGYSGGFMTNPVHSGSLKPGKNYSGIGYVV